MYIVKKKEVYHPAYKDPHFVYEVFNDKTGKVKESFYDETSANEKAKKENFIEKEGEEFQCWLRTEDFDFDAFERRAAWVAWLDRALKDYNSSQNNLMVI